jgi:hypothetical protein
MITFSPKVVEARNSYQHQPLASDREFEQGSTGQRPKLRHERGKDIWKALIAKGLIRGRFRTENGQRAVTNWTASRS